jgi:gliding motility-associated-like protein
MMKTILSSVLTASVLLLSTGVGYAQVVGIEVEVDQVHYETYTDFGPTTINLSGFVTYSVYAITAEATNRVWGIAGGACPEEGAPDCFLDGNCDMKIEFDGQLFQHEFMNYTLTSGLYPFTLSPLFPTAAFDSYLTFSTATPQFPITTFFVGESCVPSRPAVFEGTVNGDYFDGGNFYLDNGSVFTLTTEASTLAGADLRVKIAQFTTNSSWNQQYQVAWFETNNPFNDSDNETGVYSLVCQFIQNPCVQFPMDTEIDPYVPDCFGGEAGILVEDGGNGPVDYTLHNCATDAVIDFENDLPSGWTIANLPDGDYYVSMIDSLGCRDTSNCITITIPELLEFEASIAQDILCFGDLGVISTGCIGGTGTITVAYNGPGSNDGSVTCGNNITGLPTGTYALTATDQAGCQANTSITFANPADLQININQTDITCFQSDDGALTGTVTGGTGAIDAEWTGTLSQNFTGPSPLTVSITALGPGAYSLLATDANGCPVQQDYTLEEPDGLTLSLEATDASCPGVCDGLIEVSTSGGTGIPDITITGGSFDDLCPDTYTVTAADDNGCEIEETAEITSPTEIEYTFESTDLSCFGVCDGSISVTGVSEGCGSYEFALSPAAGTVNTGADFASYTGLCSGVYDLQITDACGCGITISDITVTQPSELSVVTNAQQIDCFGAGNGSIAVTSTGGTGAVSLTNPVDQDLPYTLADLIPGSYHIVIQDETGCQDSTDVIITEPAQLLSAIDQVNAVGCGGDCDGEVLVDYSGGIPGNYSYNVLDADNPDNVLWDGQLDNSGNDVVVNLCAGDFLMVVSDANGCSPDSLQFTIEEPSPIVVNINEDWITCTGMCDGSAVVLFSGGSGQLSAQFLPDALSPSCAAGACTLVDLCEGVYSVTITDEEDCSVDTTIVIGAEIETDMLLTLFSSPETCWNEMDGTATVAVQNGNPPISVVWDDPDQQTTATAVGLASSEVYTVTVTDDIGCTLTDQVEVAPTVGCFFIATAITPNGDGINDTWLLGGFEFYPTAQIQVFNRWGQVVFESRGYQAAWDGTLNGQKLPTADYYFLIEYSEEKDPIMGTVTIKY